MPSALQSQKYTVNQHLVETLLTWVKSGEIAIPEIQRPFVWDSTKVRDLMDSLYQGFPIGYLIAWKNPNVRLKDGSISEGKKVLIDGQQRITALTAAILGQYVINNDYQRVKIRIAFQPMTERFEVFNTAIDKDNRWLPDISVLFTGKKELYDLVEDFQERNPELERRTIFKRLERLKSIVQKQIGLIELASDLDIETVTEIFIRINSKGVVLSNADFAMSKIASNDQYDGPILRKAIDYFCHLAVAPEFYDTLRDNDPDFGKTDFFAKMKWLAKENDDLYDPSYTDMLRVVFVSEFRRGRLSDLVSLLSGRNFEERTFEESIAEESFQRLEKGILHFINETHFKRFVMIIRSAGFVIPRLIRSQNALNFAYILYLTLRSSGKYSDAQIERWVRKWFVMSLLTGRYSGSPESRMDKDIRMITERPFAEVLADVESANLSDGFWSFGLVQALETSFSTSSSFNTYLAAQAKEGDRGFLSRDITVNDLLTFRGDRHHIFPKDYLKKNGFKRGAYNQVANYVYMQSEINIRIGNQSPKVYFEELQGQSQGGPKKYGAIDTMEQLRQNLAENAIPEEIFFYEIDDYEDFLAKRRKLMAEKIRKYYQGL